MKKIYIIAVFVAILTGAAVYLYAQKLDRQATVVIPTGTVVIAVTSIPENTKITSEMVTLQKTALEWINADAVVSLSDVVGKINKYWVPAGQQIVRAQLSEVKSGTEGGQLSYVVEQGKRAITLSTDEIAGVGGYLSKGDYVDILSTITLKEKDEEGNDIDIPATEVVLENIRVLEVGSHAQNESSKAEDGEKSFSYGSVTLSISPEDATKLYYAISYGRVYLTLRAPQDDKLVSPPLYVWDGNN
ncbi:MAG: Flp pilus assembly protein CpaB [Bacillota bacterium]